MDAAIRPDFAIVGVVIRNHNGEVTSWVVEKIAVVSPFEVEVKAASLGLEEERRDINLSWLKVTRRL